MHRNSCRFSKPMIFNSELSLTIKHVPIIHENSPTDNPPFRPNVQRILDGRLSAHDFVLVLPVPE
jgi:hypothetical protein